MLFQVLLIYTRAILEQHHLQLIALNDGRHPIHVNSFPDDAGETGPELVVEGLKMLGWYRSEIDVEFTEGCTDGL
jgi:hypothetical protein